MIPDCWEELNYQLCKALGNVYGIKVTRVRKTRSCNRGNYIPSTASAPSGYTFLEIGIALFKNGDLLWDEKELVELSVVDSKGRTYASPYPSKETVLTFGVSFDSVGKMTRTNYVVYFEVPENSSGFKLQYRDLPLIDLGL